MRLLSSQEPPTVSPLLDVLMNALGAIIALLIVYVWMFDDQRRHVERMLVAYHDAQQRLCLALDEEFRKDLEGWNAEFDCDTLTVRFNDAGTRFPQGRAVLPAEFSSILERFFPRFIAIVHDPRHASAIEEIRIEGHTSSEWTTIVSPEAAYILNMRLSQDRARAVLERGLQTITDEEQRAWARAWLTANGLSSSRREFREDGTEDPQRSRRVEFRVRTAAERQIVDILREGTIAEPR
jgi:outer membrane protein OmpA-like peptidoglycan-associated protein